MPAKRGKHSRENVAGAAKAAPSDKESQQSASGGIFEGRRYSHLSQREDADKNTAIFVLLRHKIVAAIMLILAMLLAGIMTIIYTSSYFEVYQEDVSMLENYTKRQLRELLMLQLNPSPQALSDGQGDGPDATKSQEYDETWSSPRYRLSTFYSVLLSPNDEVIQIKNNTNSIYTDAELGQMAQAMVQSGERDGSRGDLVYLVTYYAYGTESGCLVAMMDNTVFQEISNTLLRYTLIFGSVFMLGFFFFANYLARWMVRPLENSYMHQVRFISDAGHELKTPIAVINANSELLERQIGENQWLQNIRYENERMGDLVSSLLQLAHAEKDTPNKSTLDLSRLVSGEILPFESIAFERGLTLNTNIAPDIFVEGDKMQLQQLTSILLDNALSYATEKSPITVALWVERTNAVLEVGNYSENISEEAGEHLFDRFYRADNARTGDSGHYGLGLSIAKAITKNHRGNIEANVVSGYITIRFSIPLA